MARPVTTPVQSSVQGWDATLNDWRSSLFDAPYPVPEIADFATLVATYPANMYDRCIMATVSDQKIWKSNGTTWVDIASGSVPTPQPLGVSMDVAGFFAVGNDLGSSNIIGATTLIMFSGRRAIPGTIGTTSIQLEINGVALAGAVLNWTPADLAWAYKSQVISQAVALGDRLSLRILTAETGGSTIIAEAHS